MEKLKLNVLNTNPKPYHFEVKGYYDSSNRKLLVRNQEVSYKGKTYLFIGNTENQYSHNFYLKINIYNDIVDVWALSDAKEAVLEKLQKENFYLHGPYINVDKNNLPSHWKGTLVFDNKIKVITDAQSVPAFYNFKTEGRIRKNRGFTWFKLVCGVIYCRNGTRTTINANGIKTKTNVTFYIKDGKVFCVKVPSIWLKTKMQKQELTSILKNVSTSGDIYEIEFPI